MMRMALLIAIALAGVGCSSAPTPFGDNTFTVTARFDSAVGLYEGNAVSVLGIPVGEVESIDARGTHVDVRLRLSGGTQIPADAQAVTVSTSVLTDRHIELTPVYRGGPELGDGDIIGLARTKTPVEFDRVLAMLDSLSTELGGDGDGQGPMATFVDVGAAATAGNGEQLRVALDQLSHALRLGADGGAATRDAITSIVGNLDALTVAAADNDTVVREFGSSVRQLSDLVADQNIGTGDTGAALNRIVEHTLLLLRDNRDELRSTITDSTTITTAMSDFRRELAEFFDVLPLTLDNGYNVVDQQNRAVRIHALTDKILFDGQLVKEVCNVLGLRQLGCSTGTLRDFGPDFGLVSMLEAMEQMPR